MAGLEEELTLIRQGYRNICGVDECGVGCYAGDVYAAAVIFPHDIDIGLLKGIDDSKKKSSEQRKALYKIIKQHALSYAVSFATVKEIEDLNVYWAKLLAMRRSIEALKVKPDYILVDGNARIPEISIEQKTIVKGDTKSISIAAASILAKVDRDEYMCELARHVHPDYGWESNKSYYCKKTIDAIKKHGVTKWHRKKFVENLYTRRENEI